MGVHPPADGPVGGSDHPPAGAPVGPAPTRRYRSDIGPSWWAALLVVCLGLGFVGRSSAGFWSPFLWSVVGFVVGSLVAMAVAGTRVPPRPTGGIDDADADARGADGSDR